MKKKILGLLVFASFISAHAQSYIGFYQDNYAGVQSVLFNPASIADSRFKIDVNLISISSAVGNDLYGVSLFDTFKTGYNLEQESTKSYSSNNNAVFNTDIMGPSLLLNIAPKHAIAIYTRARAIVNIVGVNGNVIDEIAKSNTFDFDYLLGSPTTVGNSWGELGLSYATVLYEKGNHFLKGGITAKYLQGVANYHIKGEDIHIQYVANPLRPELSTYSSTGTAIYGTSQDFSTENDVIIDSKSNGFGADLGLVYEWRPDLDASNNSRNDINKYKIRLGVSVTDIGSMKYNKGVRNAYDLNETITQDDFDSATNYDEFIKSYYNSTAVDSDVISKLPTAVHADVDWNVHNKFYLNLNGDLGVVDSSKLNQNSIANRVSLTPRYESKWLGVYLPFSYMQYSTQPQIGIGIRTGVFFIGSGSLFSNAFSNNSKAADFHLGMKVPIYHKKTVDTDGDGVYDDEDLCPTESGPIGNEGCPWEDKDGDGVLDIEDYCVDVAGSAENKGCPWPDSDSDGILDKFDKCPTVAGVQENAGCPLTDTDLDGVADKEDMCPTVKGTFANKGCPEVSVEVVEKLNDFFKAIVFDSGKATIRPESNDKLAEIVKVMKVYTVSTFKVLGYTDNTGNANANLQLSKSRAAAVKNYLISQGISAERISSEGYGIENPIASNNTAAGRAQNRRVEIILMN
jgi:outer membrane protein OmpA-like peptidoglycan-associated protein